MHIITKPCRHGTLSFYQEDGFIGESLKLYGEYSDYEVAVFERVLRPGDVAIDVGANIGVFTVPMAKMVGPEGKVYAFEPGRANFDLLGTNVAQNDLENVVLCNTAASDECGTISIKYDEPTVHYPKVNRAGDDTVERVTIDSLALPHLKFVKIDVDGHELEVLHGMRDTITRCRPIIYIENEHEDKASALIAELIDHDYRLYWFRPPVYNEKNFRGERRNIFGFLVSIMMICVPEEQGIAVAGCDEVADIRQDDQMFEREIKRYQRVVARQPDDLTSRLLTAHYHNLMQRGGEADKLIAGILAEDPNHTATHALNGLIQLQRGNYKEGWPAYELRFSQRKPHLFGGHRRHQVPQWDGTPTDKPLLVTHEQGFGDMIMFVRFMGEVRARAPNAFLEVHPLLYELFETSNVSPGGLYRMGRAMPPYALHCSLPSVPAILGADESIISMPLPYIWPENAMASGWRKRGGPSIGFCKHGSPRSERPYTRDIPEELVRPLNREFGPFLDLTRESGQFADFSDTAAALSTLDLVITVDTAVAHLAGAMGVPVWLLLSWDPDWRWGLKSTSSVWYPAMTIFRQHAFRDWDSVIVDLRLALADKQACDQRDEQTLSEAVA